MVDWSELHFGKLTRADISRCIRDQDWQELRLELKYKSLDDRHRMLRNWLTRKGYSFCAKVQVTNYVNALKRGGMIRIRVEDEKGQLEDLI